MSFLSNIVFREEIMLVKANKDTLLKNIPSLKHKEIFDELILFIKDVIKEKGITDKIRKKYNSKKMKGTDKIFKFRLANGYRCLYEYGKENRVFKSEPEIILHGVVDHDSQGVRGRQLEKNSLTSESLDTLNDEVREEGYFQRKDKETYLRYIPINETITTEALMYKMEEADGRFLYPLEGIQDDVLDSQGPLLLMGSAGSGKTLVEISKALKNAHDNTYQLYITFTSMLKDVGEDLYKRYSAMSGLEGETTFYALSDFYLQTLNLEETNHMSFEKFLEWFKENNFEGKYDYLKTVGPINLWTEIRGLIKGYTNNYYRDLEIENLSHYVKKETIKEWGYDTLIKKKSGSSSRYQILDIEKLYPVIKNQVPKLHEALIEKDLTTLFIDRYTYLFGMSDKYSMYDREIKEKLYGFVKDIYQPYLSENNLYDDNDLARGLRRAIHEDEVLPYDHVFIDEVQDLSELQILSLVELADQPQNVYMTGDVSQIINPTLFVKGRVGAIYKQRFEGIELNQDLTLNQNFRNGRRILDIVSKLLNIRQERLGTYTDDIREESRAGEEFSGMPFYIERNKEMFIPTLNSWIGVPNVAIIVANERSKKILKTELDLDISLETNIFTVQEVKGKEFYKAIIYNITSDYSDEWHKIMEEDPTRDKSIVTKYMYYFNILYVAMTRAKHNIFLFEEKDTPIIRDIKPLFEHLNDSLKSLMDISNYDTRESRYIQAQNYFDQEDYERAKTVYWQLDDTEKGNIAKAYSNLQKGRFEDGVKYLYAYAEHYNKALKYTHKLPVFNTLLGYKSGAYDLNKLTKLIEGKSLIKAIKAYESEEIYPVMLKDTIDLIRDVQVHRIEKNIHTINERRGYNE